jgi:seryl-tRNA synthetase
MADGDDLATVRDDWRRYVAELSEIQAERDRLAVELREALRQVEHWRTLAEYRRATLLARQQDDESRRHVPRWTDYLLPEAAEPD